MLIFVLVTNYALQFNKCIRFMLTAILYCLYLCEIYSFFLCSYTFSFLFVFNKQTKTEKFLSQILRIIWLSSHKLKWFIGNKVTSLYTKITPSHGLVISLIELKQIFGQVKALIFYSNLRLYEKKVRKLPYLKF